MTGFNKRVTIIDGWCVVDQENGDQIRARLEVDQGPMEPERGDGMWNEGVSLVRERSHTHYSDLDEHQGLAAVIDRINRVWGKGWIVYSENYDGKDTVLGSDENMEEFVSRYLRIFWDVQYAKRFNIGTYRDSTPVWGIAEGIEYGANIEAIVQSTVDEFEAWANGDVYVVVSETRTLAEAMEDGEEDYSWSQYDWPMGGYYGDSAGRYGVSEALDVPEDMIPENVYDYTDMS